MDSLIAILVSFGGDSADSGKIRKSVRSTDDSGFKIEELQNFIRDSALVFDEFAETGSDFSIVHCDLRGFSSMGFCGAIFVAYFDYGRSGWVFRGGWEIFEDRATRVI